MGWSRKSSDRLPQIKPGPCDLCGEVAQCFAFEDNEAYQLELLCKDCLLEAVRLLEQEDE